jgi:hypothetical protein
LVSLVMLSPTQATRMSLALALGVPKTRAKTANIVTMPSAPANHFGETIIFTINIL